MTGAKGSGARVGAAGLTVGSVVELTIGAVAHGGHCVARHDGRVVFVRYALPGERAMVRITEARPGSFCRGEAVEILQADPERVEPPCSHFHPGGCGGCDFQHASGARQRELKAEVVAEQLRHLAGIDLPVTVQPLPGDGFGWRTRVRWALDSGGRIGPRAYRSHRVEGINPLTPCLIAAPGLSELAATVDVPAGLRRPSGSKRRSGPDRTASGRHRGSGLPEVTLTRDAGGATMATWPGRAAEIVTEHAAGRPFSVAADGFWQAHPAAADALCGAVAEALTGADLRDGSAWDLYGGVGLFAEVLADAVGPDGSVLTVESDVAAAGLARQNMAGHSWVTSVPGRVEDILPTLPPAVDAVLLDPPRTGAGPALCRAIAERAPAVIVYVACDPAALGRDSAALAESGYRMDSLRAFDAFPQTHHVECVARYSTRPPVT